MTKYELLARKFSDAPGVRFRTADIGNVPMINASVSIDGIPSWDVGFPQTGDIRADVITMLRRIADNLENPPY